MELPKVCDHTSVGVVARDDQGRILMIKRKKYPFGVALPSGHCDGKDYSLACFDEFETETGLKITGAPHPVTLKSPRKDLLCRRGGQYHYWQIFEVDWSGRLSRDKNETLGAGWYAPDEIRLLAEKTKEYLRKLKLSAQAEEVSWQKSLKESVEKEWQADPGLEVVWYEFFKELNVI